MKITVLKLVVAILLFCSNGSQSVPLDNGRNDPELDTSVNEGTTDDNEFSTQPTTPKTNSNSDSSVYPMPTNGMFPGPSGYWLPYPPSPYHNHGNLYPPIPDYHYPPIPQFHYPPNPPGYPYLGNHHPSYYQYPPIPPQYPLLHPPYDPFYPRYPKEPGHDHNYQSHLGDDPHFAVLLPSGSYLCYSIQGKRDHVFNLISNNDIHINGLFIPDQYRNGVTWIGAIGLITHSMGQYNTTSISFTAENNSLTVINRVLIDDNIHVKTVSMKAKRVSIIAIINNQLYVRQHMSFLTKPIVNVLLADARLNFTVQFDGSHLDMYWGNVGVQAPLSHGLIGQFFRPGVELDPVRKMLIIANKEPVPVTKKPIWSFMEKGNGKYPQTSGHCWTSMNTGVQGDGLIDGDYRDYIVPSLLSTDFTPANIH